MMRENDDFVTPRKFVWANHSLQKKHMVIVTERIIEKY